MKPGRRYRQNAVVYVPMGRPAEFEQVWLSRDILSRQGASVVGFHLRKGPEAEDHTLYASHTVSVGEARRRDAYVQVARMLSAAGTMESSMSKAGLDNRHRNKDGEISGKHGNTLIRTLRKIYGQSFSAGYPETENLSEICLS
jgi:hypothetical protein